MAPLGQGCFQKGIWPFAPIVRKGTFHKKGTFVKRAIVEKNNTDREYSIARHKHMLSSSAKT